MAKEWRIIVQEGDETELDVMTSCFMVGVVSNPNTEIVGGTDACVGDVASLYLHMLEKITEHQEKYPELRAAINAFNALNGDRRGGQQ